MAVAAKKASGPFYLDYYKHLPGKFIGSFIHFGSNQIKNKQTNKTAHGLLICKS